MTDAHQYLNLLSERISAKKLLRFFTISSLCLAGLTLQLHAYSWIEGEDAARSDVRRHNWYNNLIKDQFSDGQWVSHYNKTRPGAVQYTFTIEEAGQYVFWMRANPVASKMQYKLDDRGGKDVDMSDPIDRINVAADGSLDHRFIAWLRQGAYELEAGEHQIRVRFKGGSANSGILDAFVFTQDTSWIPSGMSKPGEKSGNAEEGYFSWEPDSWDPDKTSVFDMSYFNEAYAGKHGFIRRNGDQFVRGDGKPLRFWTVQANGLSKIARDRMDWWAKRLASYGVNLVRTGGGHFFQLWMQGKEKKYKQKLDNYHALVAALKQQGIYLFMDHLYWHTHTDLYLPEEVFPGFDDGNKSIALLYFSDAFQDYYLKFLKDMLTRKNPYTGKSLAKDPAVAFVEIANESNLLFHTFKPSRLKPKELKLVERKFGDWLKEKYGSLINAKDAWGPGNHPSSSDPIADGRMHLYGAGHLSNADWAKNSRNDKRASDQLQFLVESQKGAYEKITRAMKMNIGAQQMVVPSNWKTADENTLGALEHYTYTAGDVVARNVYFGTPHKKDPRGYRIEVGDIYRDRSALFQPEKTSALQHQTYKNYPYVIGENMWTRPNRYRAEYVPLVSSYASLSGLDNWLFFALSSEPWASEMNVWPVNDTTVLGQFPVGARIYRRGDVAQGEVVVHEALQLEDLYQFEGQAMKAPEGIEDTLYKEMLGDELNSTASTNPDTIDALAYYVGPVTREVVADKSAKGHIKDIRPYVDRENKTVKSITEELTWDYGNGLFTINTPRTQGATGFLTSKDFIELDDVAIRSENKYGSVLVTSLNKQPLATTKNLLIQLATHDKTYGFETRRKIEDWKEITELGGYPLNVRKVKGSVLIKRNDLSQVTVLDGNGYPTEREVETSTSSKGLHIELPEDALYLWVHP